MLYFSTLWGTPCWNKRLPQNQPIVIAKGGYHDRQVQCCTTRQPIQPASAQEVLPVHRVQRTQDHAPIGGANFADIHRFQRGYNGSFGSPADYHPAGIGFWQHRGIGRFWQFLAEKQFRWRRER